MNGDNDPGDDAQMKVCRIGREGIGCDSAVAKKAIFLRYMPVRSTPYE